MLQGSLGQFRCLVRDFKLGDDVKVLRRPALLVIGKGIAHIYFEGDSLDASSVWDSTELVLEVLEKSCCSAVSRNQAPVFHVEKVVVSHGYIVEVGLEQQNGKRTSLRKVILDQFRRP